ncbi:SDR family NAD(P)-dependent oxidoreductase [Derxia gummosa]|uniref:SDR family NAD(P)-dependent oxidoreductase n=1 Tax=Derxia gummosa DSM 723 TaxID=1121388 RepID=A0A8B6XB16_9BURK|nr:SDR family oxidoreductase [Derxia gummosa]
MTSSAACAPAVRPALDPTTDQLAATAARARHQQRLAGKVAVVTGIGSGIGRGIALMFARQGASVVGCDLDADALAATVAAARDEGLALDGLAPLDLTVEGAAERLIAAAVAGHGGIDILVNAAAFCVFAPVDRMSLDDWHRSLRGELDLVFLACRAAWPHLVARGGGAILNFASVNAYMALDGSAAIAHCAGKGGVLAMTRQLAMEGGPHGIRANTISPGFVVTGATRRHLDEVPTLVDEVLRKKMIKRVGQAEDIAWAATFLCSDEASWVTAADFGVDGGARAW